MAGAERLVAGRYRIIRPLGAGGMGSVWLALDEALHREVAIKKCSVPDGLSEDEQQLVRDWTARDAQAVAQVRHPNVVRIHDVLTGDDQPWIVMEYIPARSLLQLINDDGPLPVGEVARIGLAVLHALNAAHGVGILHLDVKPSNILVADSGRVMLTDFGPAVTEAGIGALNQAGMILGSPNYVAPERLLDGVSSAQADFWSLGATLYHACEGRLPYGRGTAAATLRALGDGGAPDPAQLSGPLIPVLDALLQRDPADRIAPAELEERLRPLADARAREHLRPAAQRTAPAEPMAALPGRAGETGVIRRPRSRRRVAALAALAAFVVILAGVATVGRPPWSAGGDRARAETATVGSPTTQPTVQPAGVFVLPAHFRWWNDRSGFRVAVATGWPNRRDAQNAVVFTAPGGQVSLRISTWTQPGDNVVTALIGRERASTLPGYRRLRIEALPTVPEAVWEYTYRDPEAGAMRAVERIVARGGHTYLVEWRTPAQAWAGELQKLDVVVASLRPAEGT